MKVTAAWRALRWFWIAVVLLAGAGAIALQVMGPPGSSTRQAAVAPAAVAREAAPTKPVARPDAPHQAAAMPVLTGKSPGSPILPPQMALLEPLSPQSPSRLPRIGPDGMTPMAAYAGGFAPNDPRPKVGIILSGIGLSDSDSEDAIRLLPAGVTLAVSPYALHPETLLDQARAAGHELLLSIPMEPQGYPLNDEGPQELLTGAALGVNAQRLLWALSRITGYAGTTGALDGMRGERFGSITDQLGQMQDQLAARGLFYIDPRPGQPPPARVRGRGIDLVIDEPAVGFEIEAKLATLVKLAIDRGSALGLAGLPRPVTVNRLAAWATQIAAQGVVLVPASALVHDLPLPRVEAKP